MDFKTVLAGPIVRRVDAASASVWLALDQPCDVTLRVWAGLESAGTSRAPAFSGRRRTRRVGDGLHIVVVTAAGIYQPGTIYSYDIEIDNGSEQQTLDTLQLLMDGPVGGTIPHRALGYEPAMLPSFATCPQELTDLRIVHGSCRLPDNHRLDAMVWIDDFIADARTSPTGRPHQLMLSGDQIYADEPGPVFLSMASDAGQAALGMHRDDSDELVAKEELTVDGKSVPVRPQSLPGRMAPQVRRRDGPLLRHRSEEPRHRTRGVLRLLPARLVEHAVARHLSGEGFLPAIGPGPGPWTSREGGRT